MEKRVSQWVDLENAKKTDQEACLLKRQNQNLIKKLLLPRNPSQQYLCLLFSPVLNGRFYCILAPPLRIGYMRDKQIINSQVSRLDGEICASLEDTGLWFVFRR